MNEPSNDRFELRRRRAVSFHLIASGFGLTALLACLTRFLGVKAKEAPGSDLSDWAWFFQYPEKRGELLGYCISIAVLFLFFLLAALLLHRSKRSDRFPIFARLAESRFRLLVHAACASAANLIPAGYLLFQPSSSVGVAACGLLWVVNAAFPFVSVAARIAEWIAGKKAAAVWLVLAALGFAWTFAPFLLREPRMMNEFLDVPEQTLLPTSGGEVAVSNATYLEAHDPYGIRPYVRERDGERDPEPTGANRARVRLTPALEAFLNADLGRIGEEDAGTKVQERRSLRRFFYDHQRGDLVAVDGMTSGEFAALGVCVDREDQPRLQRLFSAAHAIHRTEPTPEESEFRERNRLEMHWKILNRWVVHHHNFVLGPVNEIDLGRPVSDVNMQYGWLNTVAIRAALKLLGGITYQSYLRVFYSCYVVYVVLFLAVAILLLRDRASLALVALLTAAVYQTIGFQYLFLGPGLNPIRHFFDLFVIAGLVRYLRGGRFGWLGVACAAAVLGVLNNLHVGLFALAALIATLGVRTAFQFSARRTIIEFGIVCLAAGLSICWFLYGETGRNSMQSYYAQGFCGFPLKVPPIFLLVGAGTGYLLFLRLRSSPSPEKYVFLFLLLYAQALSIYYVWGGTRYHLLNFAPIYVLTAVVGLRLFFREERSAPERRSLGVGLLVAAALFLGSAVHNELRRREFGRVFSTHVVHRWDFPRARFLSTMDPAPFQDAVERIRRYSKDPPIFMVSRYDNILPFLAERYSAMPFPDVAWFLLSEKEIRSCAEAIERNRPEFLFVDSDIERSHLNEIVAPAYSRELHVESVVRIERLGCLRELFRRSSHLYEPVEAGTLITVYRRRGGR